MMTPAKEQELTAKYDAWLEKHGLPGMCAFELLAEIGAVMHGEKSNFIKPGTVCTPEIYNWCAHFCEEWWAAENGEEYEERLYRVKFAMRHAA